MSLVSVIMTAYNAVDTIERAVRSVHGQRHRDWQLIVVDDGSTDRTAEIMGRLLAELNDPRIEFVTGQPNAGLPGARNLGLARVRGEWVTYLDSDDEYTPDRLAVMLAAATVPETDMVVCRHIIVQMDGSRRVRGPEQPGPLAGWQVAAGILREELTTYVWDKLYRTEVVRKLRFRPVHRAEDKVYNVAAALACRQVALVPAALVVYYVSPASLTWGRISSIAETEAVQAALTRAARDFARSGPGRRAMAVSRVCAYLAVAHQNLFQGKPVAHLRDRLGFADICRTLLARPLFGAAGLLLKVSPPAYAVFYRRYAARSYGLTSRNRGR